MMDKIRSEGASGQLSVQELSDKFKVDRGAVVKILKSRYNPHQIDVLKSDIKRLEEKRRVNPQKWSDGNDRQLAELESELRQLLQSDPNKDVKHRFLTD
ncbi:hypothetical protein MP228_012082 [Amoeboaphelidium protococcarum]|nr:hypothetical protein MP228_012082 [Amoeboaphelidium protococcarum]